jgi:putative transposase
MGRIARVVVPGLPHHVTQRGNRRLPAFFQDDDYRLYLDLLAEECRRHEVAIWAYSLMPNHSHLVPVPSTEAGLAAAVGEAHRRYTVAVNRRMGWTGHLWQGRFASYPLEDDYLRNVIRYVELNAVRAGLAENPWDYPYSSAAARVLGRPDPLLTLEPLQSMIEDWRAFLSLPLEEELLLRLRLHARTGRPLGSETFLRQLEEQTGLVLLPQKRGRPRTGGDTNG